MWHRLAMSHEEERSMAPMKKYETSRHIHAAMLIELGPSLTILNPSNLPDSVDMEHDLGLRFPTDQTRLPPPISSCRSPKIPHRSRTTRIHRPS